MVTVVEGYFLNVRSTDMYAITHENRKKTGNKVKCPLKEILYRSLPLCKIAE